MESVKSLLAQAIKTLTPAQTETPRLDAEVLLAHTLQQTRSWLYTHPEQTVTPAQQATFQRILHRRLNREPIAYIIGYQEFYGLQFTVSPAVLIPRPETELLVEQALALITPSARIIDVGTGSGCIAVSLAHHRPQATFIATDISAPALKIAQQNIAQWGLTGRVQLMQTDLLAGLIGPVDMIVSNPPYISKAEMATLAPNVINYEPHLALTDAGTGLSHIERILQGANSLIKPGGHLLVEIGSPQGQMVLELAHSACPGAKFELKTDLAGKDRLLMGWY